jgi:twinfilin
MQSGISASAELVSQFTSLLSSPSEFGLLVTIANEELTPLRALTSPSPSTSFSSNVSSLLTPHIKPNEALYIILRRHASTPAFAAVTYVPDAAPVRQKMLFAATRLTLVRELGSEHFRETIFATTAAELSPAGFEKHDAHVAQDAPLTEEERTLGEVKRAEQEAGSGTGTREIHLSKSLAMPVAEDAIAGLKGLASGNEKLVMLRINPDTEVVELVPSTAQPGSITELVGVISTTEPRFTFYRFEHEHGGVESAPVLFFYTCPTMAGTKSIKYRMMYPLMKKAVLEAASKEAGLEVEKKFEVEEADEITEKGVLEDLHPKVEKKAAFSRPKRPGR